MEQISIFDYIREPFKIENKIRLIELFAGYGSQAMALRNLGADFEHYRVVEFDKYAIQSYNAIHGTDFPTMDIRDIKGTDLGIVNADQFTYLMTYSFPCGLAGTKIKTEYGYKNIENVNVGEKVLTHNNRYCKVKKTMTRKVDSYNNIKVLGYPKLQLTDNHPMYVLRNGKTEWVKVKDLNPKTDMVCFNVNTENKPIPAEDNILWLVGRYVADGYIGKYSGNSVNLAIRLSKIEEFEKHIPDEFKGRFKTFDKPGIKEYRIVDKDFRDFCLEFGKGAVNKNIPYYIEDMPIEQIKIFLDGYFSGDGHKREEKDLMMFSTVSKELFLGMQNLIAKAYGTICSCYLRADKRKETFNDVYNAQFTIHKSANSPQKVIGNQIFTPIREIEHINETVDVYNFEVEEDNSYTCENIVVHNCTDISQAGQMRGFAEGSGTRSSLLWEVKRILMELNDLGTLPQVLLMENVTAIHSEENRPHLQKWLDFLENLGYSTYIEDLNAADYGVAQHRERTFALSILGNHNYKFPTIMDLNKCMENYFEDLTEEQALQYVVKSQKALDLLVELDEKKELN